MRFSRSLVVLDFAESKVHCVQVTASLTLLQAKAQTPSWYLMERLVLLGTSQPRSVLMPRLPSGRRLGAGTASTAGQWWLRFLQVPRPWRGEALPGRQQGGAGSRWGCSGALACRRRLRALAATRGNAARVAMEARGGLSRRCTGRRAAGQLSGSCETLTMDVQKGFRCPVSDASHVQTAREGVGLGGRDPIHPKKQSFPGKDECMHMAPSEHL